MPLQLNYKTGKIKISNLNVQLSNFQLVGGISDFLKKTIVLFYQNFGKILEKYFLF
jgi:hypothetical protein